jgi:hypothetical protein
MRYLLGWRASPERRDRSSRFGAGALVAPMTRAWPEEGAVAIGDPPGGPRPNSYTLKEIQGTPEVCGSSPRGPRLSLKAGNLVLHRYLRLKW